MSVEIGKVIEGTVTGITNFGAFIELPGGKTGLCHISEVSNDYVKDVKDFLKENQKVKVKVTKVDDKGKISLSIRQASESPNKEEGPRSNNRPSTRPNTRPNNRPNSRPNARPVNKDKFRGSSHNNNSNSGGSGFSNKRSVKPAEDFESMLNSFIKTSDDKLKGIKKAKSNRKGNGYNNKK